MIETVQDYMLRAYHVTLQPNDGKNHWKYRHVLCDTLAIAAGKPEDLITPQMEFACDCVWYAHQKNTMRMFFLTLGSKTEMCPRSEAQHETDYRSTAAIAAHTVISTVYHIWKTQKRNDLLDGDVIDKQLRFAIEDYFIGAAIPCRNPWHIVMACEESEELRDILTNIWDTAHMQTRRERRHYYETTVTSVVNHVLCPSASAKALRNTAIRREFLDLAMWSLGLQPNPQDDHEIIPRTVDHWLVPAEQTEQKDGETT